MAFADVFNTIKQYEHYHLIISLVRAGIFLLAGYVLARFASKLIYGVFERRGRRRYNLLIQKICFYLIFILFFISALRALGFDLKVLLGATGILTIALGFASQTSASNFISGLFLLGERAFSVGDIINVNGTSGEVIAIDLFSVRILLGDNTIVRMPNELLIKTPVINLTHYPNRRLICNFSLPYMVDLNNFREALDAMLAQEPLCLPSPAPLLVIESMSTSKLNLQLIISTQHADYGTLRTRIYEKLQAIFKAQRFVLTDQTLNLYLNEENTHDAGHHTLS